MPKRLIIFICFILFVSPVWAQPICPLDGSAIQPAQVNNLRRLEQLPILDNGRVKPFDTYARSLLLQFSGRQQFQKESASRWIARLLMAPETTKGDKIFLINHPSILQALNIIEEKKRRYSFDQIQPAFEKLRSLSQAAQQIMGMIPT